MSSKSDQASRTLDNQGAKTRRETKTPATDVLDSGNSSALLATSRRSFLRVGAGSGAALAGVLAGTGSLSKARAYGGRRRPTRGRVLAVKRAKRAAELKRQAAHALARETIALPLQRDNNDEERYADERYYASFTKTLRSNRRGEVDPASFEALRKAMQTGRGFDFDNIPLANAADRTLANPQGAFKFEPASLDGHGTRIAPSHRFRSAAIAGEMVEVYWQALLRDVPFSRYDTSPRVARAVDDLNALSATPGVAANGPVTPQSIFRGETPGDLEGPYISQFLWKDFSFGPVDVVQRYEVPVPGVDFMTDRREWLRIQRGANPRASLAFLRDKRYIHTNRALAEYVHRDVSFQAYLHAALILLGHGPDALDPNNPYRSNITNQGPFVSLGAPFVLDMVTKAANLALTGAWFQKWIAHRFLRPEAYAGRVHFHATGAASYELHPDVLNSRAAARVASRNGNYFLPLAYPEGSPTHPSYPAGHACVAGACVTVLKAYFDEDFILPDPVVADADGLSLSPYSGPYSLTAGGELDKLANNISLGRDAAGVHYRQDGIQGLLAGEQQAIALLREQSRTMNESDFSGFDLRRFDGTPIHIQEGIVS